MKPIIIEKLTKTLNALPGITKKQSEKLAYQIILNYQKQGIELAQAINEATQKINKCRNCMNLTQDEVCYICQDQAREKILVVVESPLDVFKFEETQELSPYYHVLGGLLKVSKTNTQDDLNIESLIKRSNNFSEIILALSPNLEGIVTSNYIKNLLPDKKVTQLAQGIPIGSAMEYVDKITLKAALENRKEVK